MSEEFAQGGREEEIITKDEKKFERFDALIDGALWDTYSIDTGTEKVVDAVKKLEQIIERLKETPQYSQEIERRNKSK